MRDIEAKYYILHEDIRELIGEYWKKYWEESGTRSNNNKILFNIIS